MSAIVGLRWDPRTPLDPFAEAPEVQPHPVVPEMEVARVEPPYVYCCPTRPSYEKAQTEGSFAVERTVQALKVERSRAAQHVKSPVTMLPSALRGTLRVE